MHDRDEQHPGQQRPDDRDHDLLRGGTGHDGAPSDPPTNDDLLRGGSGVAPDPDVADVVEGPIGSARLREPIEVEHAKDAPDRVAPERPA